MNSPRTGHPLLSSEKRASTFLRKLLKTRVAGCLCWWWSVCSANIGVSLMSLKKKIVDYCVINVRNIILGYAMESWHPAYQIIDRPALLRTFTYSQKKGRVCIIIQDCHVWPTVRTSTSWVLKGGQSSFVVSTVTIATSQWDSSSEFIMDLVSFFNLLPTLFPPKFVFTLPS